MNDKKLELNYEIKDGEGIQDGVGSFTFRNGDKYVGNWVNY